MVFLQLLTVNCQAQTYFNKEFSNNLSIYNNGSFVHQFADSSGYMAVGVVTIGGGTVYTRFLRLDIMGDTLWTKLYGNNGVAKYTNIGNYVSLGDTNFVFTGTYSEGSSDSLETVLFKIDSSGNVLWDYRFGESDKKTASRDIKSTPDGGFIITGWTTGWNVINNTSSFLLKVNSNGLEEWHQIYGGGSVRESYSVEVTADSGYIISGQILPTSGVNTDLNVIKTDSLGNLLWNKNYGTPEKDNGFTYISRYGLTDDYIVVGGVDLVPSTLIDLQGYISRISGLDGSVVWADTMGVVQNGINEVFNSNVIILPDGSIVGIGGTSDNGIEAWLVKYDGNGNLLWKRDFDKYGGNSRNYFWDVHQTYDNGFVICGDLLNTNIPEKNLWVLKLDSNGCEIPNCTVGVSENLTSKEELLVYPNPSSGIINFKLLAASKNAPTQLFLFDITGKTILNTSFRANTKQLDVSSYPKGIYFYQLINGEERYSGKVVIQ